MTTRPGRSDADEVVGRALRSLRFVAPAVVVLAAIAVGLTRGVPLAVLVLAGGALAAVIALFWQSVRTLVGETQLSGADAFALGTPHVEEERKRAVLRALKDLEFERSVGKISEDDYRQLVVQYRAEAKRLLRRLDDAAQPRRERVARLVDERLRAAGLAGGLAEAVAAPAPARAEPPEPPPDAPAASAEDAPRPTCRACGTANDADAAFCKKCGASIAGPAAVDEPSATDPRDGGPAATDAATDEEGAPR